MSGHSKWHSIKHKKGAADAKRGKLFSKLARAITVAARDGGGYPGGNPTLATAIQKAKEASMPKDKIQKAIDVGTGAGSDGAAIERVLYEGYGPAGVAVTGSMPGANRRTAPDSPRANTASGPTAISLTPNGSGWEVTARLSGSIRRSRAPSAGNAQTAPRPMARAAGPASRPGGSPSAGKSAQISAVRVAGFTRATSGYSQSAHHSAPYPAASSRGANNSAAPPSVTMRTEVTPPAPGRPRTAP